MKKISKLSLLLVAIMTVALLVAGTFVAIGNGSADKAYAASATSADLNVGFSSTTLAQGDEFTVTFGLTNRVGGLFSIEFLFNYNADVFQYVSSTKHTSNTFSEVAATNFSFATGVSKVSCSDSGIENVTGDQTLYTAVYKVKDDAIGGTYTFTITEANAPYYTEIDDVENATVNYNAAGYTVTVGQSGGDEELGSADATHAVLDIMFSNTNLSAGSEFTVTFGLTNRIGGLFSIEFLFNYNQNIFEYVSSTKHTSNTFSEVAATNFAYATGASKISCSDTGIENVTGDQTLYVATYRVKDGVAGGTYSFTVTEANAPYYTEIYDVEQATVLYQTSGYPVTITLASSDASLGGFSVMNGSSPVTVTGTATPWAATVPYTVSRVNVKLTGLAAQATATINGAAYNATSGYTANLNNTGSTPNVINVVVTAQAGNTASYVLNITRTAADTNVNLIENSVKMTKGSDVRTATWNSATNRYVFDRDVEYGNKDGWTLSAQAQSSLANVSGTGALSLTEKDNLKTITVRAESGAQATYTVEIYVKLASRDTGATINVTDVKINADAGKFEFNKVNANNYSLKLSKRVTSVVVTVVPNASTATATVVGSAAATKNYNTYTVPVNENTTNISITVNAQIGSEVYSITLSHYSNNTSIGMPTILDMAGNTIAIAPLANNTPPYGADVNYAVDRVIIKLNGIAAGASCRINGIEYDSVNGNEVALPNDNGRANTILVRTEAEDGITWDSISVILVRKSATAEAAISSVTIAGYTVNKTNTNTFTVSELVRFSDKDSLTAVITPSDDYATIKLGSEAAQVGVLTKRLTLVGGANTIPVVVTSQDGQATTTYSLVVNVAQPNTNVAITLDVRRVDNTTVGMRLEEATATTYNLYLAKNVLQVRVDALPIVSTTVVTVELAGNPNPLTPEAQGYYDITLGSADRIYVKAIAQSGSEIYTINIIRLSDNVDIGGFTLLDVNGGNISVQGFGSPYTATVNYAIDTVRVKINGLPTGATATVNDQAYNEDLGNLCPINNYGATINTITVGVTAQDGLKSTSYEIRVTRNEPAAVAEISSITIEGYTVQAAGTTFTVQENVAFADRNSLTAVITPSDSYSFVKFGSDATQVGVLTKQLYLDQGNNTFSVTVTSQDGSSSSVYSLIINVIAASKDTSLKPNNPKVYNGDVQLPLEQYTTVEDVYVLNYSSAVSEIKVFAQTNDANATMRIVSYLGKDPVGTHGNGETIELANINTITITVTAEDVRVPVRTYTILLTKHVENDPSAPAEEQDIFSVSFDDINAEGGSDPAQLGFKHSDDSNKKDFNVDKSLDGTTLSLKVPEGTTVDVLYGATVIEEQEAIALQRAADVVYVFKKFAVQLSAGNNPIVFRVNETGIAGADEIYVLNIVKPYDAATDGNNNNGGNTDNTQPAKFNKGGWIAGIVILCIFLAAAIVVIVLLLLRLRKDEDNNPDDNSEEKSEEKKEEEETAAATEETPIEDETPVEEAPAEETPVEEAPVEEVPAEEAPVEEAPVEEVPAEETPVEEAPVEEVPAEEAPVEEAPVEEAPAEEAPVEEAPAEETPVEEAPQEEAVVEEVLEAHVEETPVEETPAEEASVEETPAEEAPAEKAPVEEAPAAEAQEDNNDVENDGTGIQIKNVLSHKEKYEALSREQKIFYDELKLRALSLPGSMITLNKNNEIIRVGQKRIIKLTIRREMAIACFYPENQSVAGIKKAFRGKEVRIKTKETEIPIADVNAFNAAKEMLQVIVESIYNQK